MVTAWLCLALLGGCLQVANDTVEGGTGTTEGDGGGGDLPVDRPCPGHFHITLLVAEGDDVIDYVTVPDDGDARAPVPGIHMHGPDGVIHIHPAAPTCYTFADAWRAVGITLAEDAITVDGQNLSGIPAFDIQAWNGSWQTVGLAEQDGTVLDASRVLLRVGDGDVEALRAQVPQIPEQYRPR